MTPGQVHLAAFGAFVSFGFEPRWSLAAVAVCVGLLVAVAESRIPSTLRTWAPRVGFAAVALGVLIYGPTAPQFVFTATLGFGGASLLDHLLRYASGRVG